MTRIRVTVEAYEAIKKTLPPGSFLYPVQPAGEGMVFLWLDPKTVNQLRDNRRPGEGFSEVILRIAEAAGPTKRG